MPPSGVPGRVTARGAAGRRGRKAGSPASGISSTLIVVGVIAVVVIAGIAYLAVRRVETRPCTPTGAHEHASFSVFASGQEYAWTGPQFNFGNAGSLAGHIHQPASHTIHMESGTTCITVASFFEQTLQSSLSKDSLTLDKVIHNGETFKASGDAKMRFFIGEPPTGWRDNATRQYLNATEVAWRELPDLPSHQPRDGEYFLVEFGNATDEVIRAHEMNIPRQDRSEGAGH